MEQLNVDELYKELRFQYKRVNGKEMQEHAPMEGKAEQWRVALMIKAIETFKKCRSFEEPKTMTNS